MNVLPIMILLQQSLQKKRQSDRNLRKLTLTLFSYDIMKCEKGLFHVKSLFFELLEDKCIIEYYKIKKEGMIVNENRIYWMWKHGISHDWRNSKKRNCQKK